MDFVDRYLTELESVVHRISRDEIRSVVAVLFEAWRRRQTIFLIGNGGSAATASHMMNDLNKFTIVDGLPRFRCIALTDNVPLMTAVGNDVSYADVFVEPLKNLLQAGDVLVAISASGSSPNIVKAVEYARACEATVVGLCGQPGGRLAQIADVAVVIPSDRIGQQEDGHIILDHVISATLHEQLSALASLGSGALAAALVEKEGV
jgi:D-sedoheptulose 7-phosphate isomerase